MFRLTFWIDLYNLQTLFDHVVKKIWINLCFVLMFGWEIGLVFQLFLSDNVGTTFDKTKRIDSWSKTQNLLFNRRCLHWECWCKMNRNTNQHINSNNAAGRFCMKTIDWYNIQKSQQKYYNQYFLVKYAKTWYVDAIKWLEKHQQVMYDGISNMTKLWQKNQNAIPNQNIRNET